MHVCARDTGLDGPVTATATGRDLLTGADGTTQVLDQTRISAVVDFPDGTIRRIEAEPAADWLGELVGSSAVTGFRRRVQQVLPEGGAGSSICQQLLDDLPITLLLSARVLRVAGIGLGAPGRTPPIDLCAGWGAGGVAVTGYDPVFGPPLARGPLAPDLAHGDDPLAWHGTEAPPPGSTTRRRRIDVWANGSEGHVDSMFRDSYVDDDGVETVVHEYGLSACVELETGALTACEAVPGPLPYPECPGAAASTRTLVGTRVHALRGLVPSALTGASTCTHLNDALRALDGVGALLEALDVASRVTRTRRDLQ